MCGRLSQYRGIHDFVAALRMPGALVNSVGDQPLERYNVAPTTQVTLLRLEGETLHADPVRWGWRPHWAKDRAAPINARIEKVANGPFFRAIWPHRAITPIDNWFEWVDEGGPKKQPYMIRRRDRDHHRGQRRLGWWIFTTGARLCSHQSWPVNGLTRPRPKRRQDRWPSTWESHRTPLSGTG